MKLETYLNAMIKAHTDYESDWIVSPKNWDIFLTRRKRQKNAFRARILRMYQERDSQASKAFDLWTIERGITKDLRRQLDERDAEKSY